MVPEYRSINLISTIITSVVILSEAKDPLPANAATSSARSFLLCSVATSDWQLGTGD
jgi:hypothetical protein